MTGRAVKLTRLQIDRAPGIERGRGWVLGNLSPGFNLIHGPNGSGKTTTARTIQALLWPSLAQGQPTVSGSFDFDGEPATMQIEAGTPVSRVIECGPSERASRYLLAFDDLLKSSDSDMAKTLRDEMAGGYDLDAAASSLGYAPDPTLPRGALRDYDAATKAVAAEQRKQEQLQHRAGELATLRLDRATAEAAAKQRRSLDLAMQVQAKAAELQAIEAERAALPPEVAKLSGDEAAEVAALEQAAIEATADRRAAETSRAKAVDKLASLKLPDDNVPPAVLATLNGLVREAREAATQLATQRREAVKASAAATEARRVIGHAIEVPLTVTDGDDFMAHARRADALRAERAVLDAQRQQLARPHDPTPTATVEQLRDAATSLARWLAATPAGGDAAKPTAWAALAAVSATLFLILGIVLAVSVHVAWLALGLIGVAVFVSSWLLWRRPTSGALNEQPIREREFAATGVASPDAWDVATVASRLTELATDLVTRRAADASAEAASALQSAAQRLDADEAALDAARNALQQRLGVTLPVEDAWLPVLVGNLRDWQGRHADALAADAAVVQQERELAAVLSQVVEVARAFGFAACESAEVAAEIVPDLSRRQAAADEARREMSDADRQRREADTAARRASDALQALLERLGTDADEIHLHLSDWLRLRGRFVQLDEATREAELAKKLLVSQLGDDASLVELTPDALAEQMTDAADAEDRLEGVRKQMADIEAEIRHAKQGGDLSAALAEQATAREKLEGERERCRRAAAGAALVDWLKEQAQRDRPAVFERANALLVRVTSGRLKLELEGDGFAAVVDGDKRPLNKLSLGERTQVLTSVRLAFLTHDEPAKLPLILDEVLANTDDERADVLIDVLLDQASVEGRQVFCFTAQRDEAGKWLSRLEKRGMVFETIDLASVRGLGATVPLAVAAVDKAPLMEPENDDRHAYAAALNVGRFDPAKGLAATHVWHVSPDNATTLALLRHGIERASQLVTLLEVPGATDLAFLHDRPRIEASLRALQAAIEAWQVGRATPLDRGVLDGCEGVSERYLQRVADCAAGVSWDGERLIEALKAGEVKGFREKQRDQLEAELRDRGHINEEPLLDRETVRGRMLVAASPTVLDAAWVEAVLAAC